MTGLDFLHICSPIFIISVPMRWTEEHDIVLCREVLVAQPYQYRAKSAERGSAWTSIANELNAVQEIRFCVTQKAVRDRMKLLVERHKKKTREEESASGISPEESEIDEALDTIIELIDDAEQHFEKDSYEKQQKIENNRKQAEELRVKAMESYGESRKRQLESGESEPKPRRKRATGGETLVYLQEKSEKEFELRKAELEIKKKEVENKRQVEMTLQKQQQQQFTDFQKTIMEQYQQQQAMNQQQMQQQALHHQQIMASQAQQQQQQQNQLLLVLLEKLAKS